MTGCEIAYTGHEGYVMYRFSLKNLMFVASASGGGKACYPGRLGPLASPTGPHPPEDQRGGAVVPAAGLHTAWPWAPTQEWWRVHRGHPHADRQWAWCVVMALSHGLLLSAAQRRNQYFPLSAACVGVFLLQLFFLFSVLWNVFAVQ